MVQDSFFTIFGRRFSPVLYSSLLKRYQLFRHKHHHPQVKFIFAAIPICLTEEVIHLSFVCCASFAVYAPLPSQQQMEQAPPLEQYGAMPGRPFVPRSPLPTAAMYGQVFPNDQVAGVASGFGPAGGSYGPISDNFVDSSSSCGLTGMYAAGLGGPTFGGPAFSAGAPMYDPSLGGTPMYNAAAAGYGAGPDGTMARNSSSGGPIGGFGSGAINFVSTSSGEGPQKPHPRVQVVPRGMTRESMNPGYIPGLASEDQPRVFVPHASFRDSFGQKQNSGCCTIS